MVAWPEIMMAGPRLSVCRSDFRMSMPLPSGRRTSSRNTSARPPSAAGPELRHRAAHRHGVPLALQNHPQRPPDVLFVVDDKDAFHNERQEAKEAEEANEAKESRVPPAVPFLGFLGFLGFIGFLLLLAELP